MREQLISIGDDFWIEDEHGERVFRVDGKELRARETVYFEDAQGRRLCRIQQRPVRVRDSMEIEGPDGGRLALVRKAMITPLRERWTVDVENGPDWDVQGNIVDHEYRIEADGHQIGEVSKAWFRVRDTYGVEVAPGQDDVLLLAVTVAVESMADSET
jgi:uncharacterized protein YxjI